MAKKAGGRHTQPCSVCWHFHMERLFSPSLLETRAGRSLKGYSTQTPVAREGEVRVAGSHGKGGAESAVDSALSD